VKPHAQPGQSMIASFARNFIFIKTRKTAGTTAELLLTPACGPDDILTPLTLADELMRLDNGRIAARNYHPDKSKEAALAEAMLARNGKAMSRLRRKIRTTGGLVAHMSARAVREKLPVEFWRGAFKFTIERHPYEQVVSTAFWKMSRQGGKLEAWIERAIKSPKVNRDLYTIDGAVAVDEIIRQESLAEGLGGIAARLGIALPENLPRAKGFFRTDRRLAREILTGEQKGRIFERDRATFELLGYEP
jgi:hypothetical protein